MLFALITITVWIVVIVKCRGFLRRKGRSQIESTGGAFIASCLIMPVLGILTTTVYHPARDAREAQAAVENAAHDAKEAQAAVVAVEQKKVRETQREAERKVEEARCRTDLECWGNKNSLMAIFKCQDPIERLAKNQAEWTDGILEPKFSHFRWEDRARGIITYGGDKIKFQNGFGAWQHKIYECDYDTQHDVAIAVRVRPGQLP